MRERARQEFLEAVASPGADLALTALRLARVEYPELDPAPWLAELDAMGEEARARVARADELHPGRPARIAALTHYFYEERGFTGDREFYEDPRNSFLNQVLERRAGIPITLAVVLLEIGRRAEVPLEGVNFPGHFLVRAPAEAGEANARALLIDPFHEGAIVSERDCQRLLHAHVGGEAVLSGEMFATAGKREIMMRMLLNLKRAYVRQHSFPQARDVTELLVRLEPAAITELRDRGLLSYHLHDLSSALRDLEEYLRVAATPDDDEGRQERAQIWEHVKTLRKRLASFN
jgi:regulator of sirC expression with transglutaminase-like and TPR domain